MRGFKNDSMKLHLTISLPRALQQRLAQLPHEARRTVSELAAQIVLAEAVRHFERGGYETETGAFMRWKPLSPLTLALSAGIARRKVGRGRLRYGRPTVAVGRGGVQRTAVVRRTAQSKPLVHTGQLRASLLGGAGHVHRVGAFEIEVGTNLPYAAVHHYGATIRVTPRMRGYLYATSGVWVAAREFRIPARPFLVVSKTALRRIRAAVESYLAGYLRRDSPTP